VVNINMAKNSTKIKSALNHAETQWSIE